MGHKYDDAGWHWDGAAAVGQPPEYGMVHMAMYWAWIVRRGWCDPEFVTDEALAQLRQYLPGSAINVMEISDGKLVDEPMAEEAVAFSNYYYDRYVDDWAAEFADFPTYAVPDTETIQRRAERLIDRRYNEWVGRGRPGAWTPSVLDRLRASIRSSMPTVVLVAVIPVSVAVLAIAGSLLHLRGFPWPLIQLAIVVLAFAATFWYFVRTE